MSSSAMMVYRGSHGAGAKSGDAHSAGLSITAPDVGSVPRYGRFEAYIETGAQYENPFDPAEANLLVHFLAPNGETHVLPAFYDEEVNALLGLDGMAESAIYMTVVGKPVG